MRKVILIFIPLLFLTGCGKEISNEVISPPSTPLGSSPSVSQAPTVKKVTEADLISSVSATIKTEKGSFTAVFHPQIAPKTVANFLEKFESGYFKNLTFHRVEDWVVQGGDPKGNGTGGGNITTELNDLPFGQWSVGVARGQDIRVSNDSQFFVCKTNCSFLTGQYTNLGKVTSGIEVVQALEVGDKILDTVVSN